LGRLRARSARREVLNVTRSLTIAYRGAN